MKKKILFYCALFICFQSGAETLEEEKNVLAAEEVLINDETSNDKEMGFVNEEIINEQDLTDETVQNENVLEETESGNEEQSVTTPTTENKIEPVYKDLGFPGMDRIEVENFRKQYLSEKWLPLLRSYLESAMNYRIYVRKAISDRNLPEILEYLPVVESNYKINAKSKSGALGMWQFMENSVAPFLVCNDFIDERLDPWKSTDAALSKLTDNYNYFGDWLIAIAAYNCGTGAMARYIKKGQSKDFWKLIDKNILPKQTSQYVPKLLAIADLAINHEYYGIDLPDHKEEYELLENEKNAVFDYLTVKKAYSISQLAQEMRLSEKTLKNLNPALTKGMTHPSKETKIRLPSGMLETAENALKNIEPINFPFQYKVVKGDSLWSISRQFGVTVQSLCDINNIKENDILRIGKILYIPSK